MADKDAIRELMDRVPIQEMEEAFQEKVNKNRDNINYSAAVSALELFTSQTTPGEWDEEMVNQWLPGEGRTILVPVHIPELMVKLMEDAVPKLDNLVVDKALNEMGRVIINKGISAFGNISPRDVIEQIMKHPSFQDFKNRKGSEN